MVLTMDFKQVTKVLLTAFDKEQVRYALIGGLALGAWGIPRGTVDIDFLVHRDDMQKVHAFMTEMEYERRYHTENVSQYVSSLKIFGEVDFLHAFRETTVAMLKRAEDREIFSGALTIKVLKIEDLIGLKVQAIASDKKRKTVDLPDIESLISLYREEIEWSHIKEYFTLFGFNELFTGLKEKYGSDE